MTDFIRGTTFDRAGVVTKTVDGAPATPDFSGWPAPTCQVRKLDLQGQPGQLVAALTCEWLDASIGAIRVHEQAPTDDWLIGACVLDIRFVDLAGNKMQTTMAGINVVKGSTNGTGNP